ncbi:hypothetical protein B0H19DRAFT_1270577 [Mycena capillaripes]|nr:hypothetical protein B0H19DRAFT_1270577 [Mycena capillaripes]
MSTRRPPPPSLRSAVTGVGVHVASNISFALLLSGVHGHRHETRNVAPRVPPFLLRQKIMMPTLAKKQTPIKSNVKKAKQ